jgi:hypothetical protein
MEMPQAIDDRLIVEDHGCLLVVCHPPAISAATMRSLVGAIERAYDRRERFAVISDTTRIRRFPDAAARQVLTDWIANPSRRERERAFTVATATVIPLGPVRALAAALSLARRPFSPEQWTKTLLEAAEWTKRHLIDAGVPVTAQADAFFAEVMRRRA